MSHACRLVITVCPRELGRVVLPVRRGGRAMRLDAADVVRELTALAARRGLADRVRIREGCAGGCSGAGPNVDVTVHRVPPQGERADHVAIGRRSYVYSLGALDCLAAVIEENLPAARRGRRPRPPGR
ncbi:MAG TPA: hypothetical protein VGU22_07255 [Methylomirabilota bacterium]|nr:hypothetical protein [Methylomirabilota bacterium]